MDLIKSAEHRFKAGLFHIARLFLKPGRGISRLDASKMRKILFLRPEKLGDMVISFPVFDALSRKYSHLQIDLVASPRNRPIIGDDPRFSKVYLYRKNLLKDWRMLKEIRRTAYDCVLDMIDDDSVTALFLSQLSVHSAPRVGIGKVKYAAYYDCNHVHRDGIGGHILDNTLKLLEPFGIAATDVNPYAPPYIPKSAGDKADRIMADLGPVANVVGFNLSAGMPTRLWPEDKCKTLVKGIRGLENPPHVLLITAPDDRKRGEAVLSSATDGVSMVPPGMSLIEVSALLARLNILISPDTSLVHIARSFDVPVVGLYTGAVKNFTRWRPYGQADGAVVSTHEGHLFDIAPADVLRELQTVLNRTKAGVA